jgi:rubrerythrin
MTQEQAAVHMAVSRPTITRIYETARQKVAKALTEGKDLIIRGGKFHFDESWFRCPHCKANFNIYEDSEKKCPVCSSTEIVSLNQYYSE